MALATNHGSIITSINGVAVAKTPTATQIKDPASFSWGQMAVNDPDAGNSASGKMYIGLIGFKRTLDVKWTAITPAQAAVILAAVNASSYITIVFHDLATASDVSKVFYVGDRTSDIRQWWVRGERVDLQTKFIEREVSST